MSELAATPEGAVVDCGRCKQRQQPTPQASEQAAARHRLSGPASEGIEAVLAHENLLSTNLSFVSSYRWCLTTL